MLDQSNVSGNLAVKFNWGKYVIWHLGTQIKVSIDGRRETVYPDTVYDKYIDFHLGIGEWGSILEDYETHLALVKVAQPSYNFLKMKPGWVLIYEDSISAIFVSQDWDQFSTVLDYASDYEDKDLSNEFP